MRAWAELHSGADVARTGRKRTPTPRLRVYGSWALLDEMNWIIAAGANLSPRKLQKMTTNTGTTWCLCYMGRSARAALKWLYAGAGLYNPAARKKYEEILYKAEQETQKNPALGIRKK